MGAPVDSWFETAQAVLHAFLFSLVGIGVGIGQLLLSGDKLSPRLIVGRALSTGGLGMVAGMGVLLFPDMPLCAQMGLAAALASLGTSALERIFQRFICGGQQ